LYWRTGPAVTTFGSRLPPPPPSCAAALRAPASATAPAAPTRERNPRRPMLICSPVETFCQNRATARRCSRATGPIGPPLRKPQQARRVVAQDLLRFF